MVSVRFGWYLCDYLLDKWWLWRTSRFEVTLVRRTSDIISLFRPLNVLAKTGQLCKSGFHQVRCWNEFAITGEWSGVATNGRRRVRGSQILIRAPGLTNLGAQVSPTSTVTLRMIYFTTGEIMFTPADSNVYMTIIQLSGPLISLLGKHAARNHPLSVTCLSWFM